MTGFTRLEQQAFAALGESFPEIAEPLRRLTGTARVTARDNTGFGFFTKFEVDRSQRAIGGSTFIETGFNVQVQERSVPMSFILWRDDDGYPTCLEGWQAGDERVDLKQFELASLVRWGN